MRPFLIKKLEEAFSFMTEEYNLKGVIENPLVISYLRNADSSIEVYLIAKDPKEDTFFGLQDTNFFALKKVIAGIPAGNLESSGLNEYTFKPFRLKKFIEENIKEYIEEDILKHFLFMNPQLQKEMGYIYHKPDSELIAKDRLESKYLTYLKYKEDIKFLPFMFMTTKVAINILGKDAIGNYLFKFKKTHFGLEDIVNPIDLMEQLIIHCYKIKDSDEFFRNVYLSDSPLLIHFAENVKNKFSNKTQEIVDLLNMTELDPNISYKDIIYGKTKARLLIFNKFAYERLFKSYMN